MKKHLILLPVIFAVLPANLSAADGDTFDYTYEGQTINYTVISEADKTVGTSSHNDVSENLTLPATVINNGIEYTLTAIGDNSFYECRSLISVTIPNSVTIIGNYAFRYCDHITSITIPNSVTTIGTEALAGLWDLTSVTIPNSVTEIGSGAFSWSGLTSLPLLNSVTRISNDAFKGCYYLTSVTVPNSITEIGSGAFKECLRLTSVIIGPSVTKIGSDAFYGCTELHKGAYPKNLVNPFSDGISIAYNPKVAIIEDGWIYGPMKCSIIFASTSLTGDCVIPNSVSVIGEHAFIYCSAMTSVTIPNSVTEIGSNAFYGCTGLTSVTYLDSEPLACNSNIFSHVVYEDAILNYLMSAGKKIAETEPWSLFKNRIGRDADFKEDSGITEVHNMETGVTEVYDMRGVKVGTSTEGLPHGIYIVRQGSATRKIAI